MDKISFCFFYKMQEIFNIILFCFCKSATGCAVCANRAVVNTVVSHINSLDFPQARTVCCVPYDTITPVSRHVLSVSRALYMELHFHVLVIVRRDYHFHIKCLFLHERIPSIYKYAFIASLRHLYK